MTTTLYGVTKEDARVLVDHFSQDSDPINSIALLLWSRGKASDLERAVYKAKKLIRFSDAK